MQIIYPDWYDEAAAFEHEKKGFLEGVRVRAAGVDAVFDVYDPVRLAQDIAAEAGRGGYWCSRNRLLVVQTVDREQIAAALAAVCAEAAAHVPGDGRAGLPVFRVDPNEMIDPERVLLSREDWKTDRDGVRVALYAGLRVAVYSEDVDGYGRRDDLVGYGVVELNGQPGWSEAVKWCCRLDGDGMRHASRGPGGGVGS